MSAPDTAIWLEYGLKQKVRYEMPMGVAELLKQMQERWPWSGRNCGKFTVERGLELLKASGLCTAELKHIKVTRTPSPPLKVKGFEPSQVFVDTLSP